MPNALNYAQAYQQALAQAYPNVLHFAALRSAENDARYRWLKRNYENAWEPKKLSNHRKWSTLIHPMDIDETNQVASIQNITQVFNEEQKFPEMDAYLVSKLYADWAAAGGVVDTTALTVDNILQAFDGYMEAMDEHNVPGTGRILYVTPAINTMLKNAKDIARFVQNGESAIRRAVRSLDDVQTESVPSALMKTVYDFTVGYQPGAGAKQIHMLLVHPSAIITPEKYQFAQLDAPSAGSEGKYVYFEESYDDVFILNKRKAAIMFNIEA